jgi:hypothetical protein
MVMEQLHDNTHAHVIGGQKVPYHGLCDSFGASCQHQIFSCFSDLKAFQKGNGSKALRKSLQKY